MKKILIILISMIMVFNFAGFVGTADAALITFDEFYQELIDLRSDPYVRHVIPITDQYHDEFGITFEQTYAIYDWNQSHVARQYTGDVAAIPLPYSESIFTFDNVLNSFEILADAFDDTLYLDAYDSNDNLVKSYSQYLENGNWYTMSIDLTDVSATKIVIHDNGGSFGFNDISFEAVPIPSSMLLLALGFIGLVGIKRKFRKS